MDKENVHSEPLFTQKELVEVAARTMPGFNFQGGTARISKVRDERTEDGGPMKDGSTTRTTGFTYDVKYVMGGSERRVDARWITSKVQKSRSELGEERQKEAAKRKEEKEEMERKKAEIEERKKSIRQEIAKKRAAKKNAAPVAVKKRKLAASDDDDKVPSKVPKKTTTSEDDDKVVPPEPTEVPPEPELAPEVIWLQATLSKVPPSDPEAPDELALDDVKKFLDTSSDLPAAFSQDRDTALLTALNRLEASNYVMICDGTIFVV